MSSSIGKLIRHRRGQDRMTLAQAAAKIGISVSYLSDLERGRTEPSLEVMRRLSAFYGLEVTHIRVVELEAEVLRLRKIVDDVRKAVQGE